MACLQYNVQSTVGESTMAAEITYCLNSCIKDTNTGFQCSVCYKEGFDIREVNAEGWYPSQM